MNRKLIKVLCLFIPIAKWRRNLRNKVLKKYNNICYKPDNLNYPTLLKIDKNNSNNKLDIVIINDTRRGLFHLGCFTVMNNIEILCYKNNLNILHSLTDAGENFNEDEYRKIIGSSKAIIINGEGTLHDDAGPGIYRRAEIAKEMGKKVILINAVWQNNLNFKKYLKLFDLISVRESNSLNEVIKDGAKDAFITPDLVFYSRKSYGLLPIDLEFENKKKILFVDNSLKTTTQEFEIIAKKMSSDMLYMHQTNNHLLSFQQLSNYKNIISGRFHTLCIAMMLGIPTLSAESNTYKINGVLKDAGIDLNKYSYKNEESINNFLKLNHIEFKEKSNDYVNNAIKDIELCFNKIYNIINNN